MDAIRSARRLPDPVAGARGAGSRLIIAVGAATAVIASTGCGAPHAEWRMTLAGASPGGAWSAIGEAITDELRRGIAGSVFTLEPGQDGANAALVHDGRVELGLVHASVARAAIAGTYPFEAPASKVRGVMLVYGNAPFQFVVDRRAGISAFEDIRAKRLPLDIAVNTRGSLMELATRTVLEAYGVTYDSIRAYGGALVFAPLGASYEAMRRGRIDALGVTAQVPTNQTIDASRQLDLGLLSLSGEAIAFANERLGTDTATIPAGTYPFQTSDVRTFAGRVILVTSADVPDERVYLLTKTLHDRLDALRRAHRSLEALTPHAMPEVGGVPLHAGAARFYREIGVR